MRLIVKLIALSILVAMLAVGVLVAYVTSTGLRSQASPGAAETKVARAIRSLAIPRGEKSRVNPLANSTEAAAEGLQHFARYCAMCHGNNGSGEKTPIGTGLYPKPPDLRSRVTQQLTDGELFYIIENGVRFTGMPAFGTGVRTEAGDRQTWQLVTFIRRLPTITANEIGWMESLNPL
jgi:mono/diheme cytochrome c family protein